MRFSRQPGVFFVSLSLISILIFPAASRVQAAPSVEEAGRRVLDVISQRLGTSTPEEEAMRRSVGVFNQYHVMPIAFDSMVVEGPWREVPFDRAEFTYSFDEIEEKWPHIMRAMHIPFPSAEFLESRYQHFPDMAHKLGYQDEEWEYHSLNVLETWQAFLRGDFRRARDLGIKYGGYAMTPAMFAQIVQAVYVERTHEMKQMLLQDAVNRIEEFAHTVPYSPNEEAYHAEYITMRQLWAYAVGRLAEDEPVPVMVANNYAPMVINAVNEVLAIEPQNPLFMAMYASFDANVIRRVGKTAGMLAIGADSAGAHEMLWESIVIAGDLPITRYEYANALLYMERSSAIPDALEQLRIAVDIQPSSAMEKLDILYAAKRQEEIRILNGSGKSFSSFDKARRKYMRYAGVNLYCVTLPPFRIDDT